MSETDDTPPTLSQVRALESVVSSFDEISIASFGGNAQNRRENVSTKLDVMRAKHINRISYLNLTLVCAFLVYATYGAVSSRVFNSREIPVVIEGKNRTLPGFRYSGINGIIDSGSFMLTLVTYYTIGPLYFLRVFRNNLRPATHEQKMVALGIGMNMVGINPVIAVANVNDFVFHEGNPAKQFRSLDWFKYLLTFLAMQYLGWSPGMLLYIWIQVDSFAQLRPIPRMKFFLRIILPKLAICLSYYAVILGTFFPWYLNWSFMPFSSLICVLMDINVTGRHHAPSIISVSFITAFEIIIFLGIAASVARANKILRAADYNSHRSKIVGFRFFVFHNALYVFGLTLCDNLLCLLLPAGERAKYSFGPNGGYFYTNYYYLGAALCLKLAWLVIIAYMNLPHDSVGLRGWVSPCTVDDDASLHRIDETEPVTFSLQGDCVTNPSIFAFHDVTLMLNFSWLAYASSREEVDFYASQIGTPDMFDVIVEETFDTRLIIANLSDRIIIAFRGTKSTKNMKTDLKVDLGFLGDYIPTRPPVPSDEQPSNKIKGWNIAKIHHGFGESYHAVAETVLAKLQLLIAENRRPIFFTGHSLGGALATVCSLDILMSGLSLSSDQITAVTFGSPKCGNAAWAALHNKMVPSHWRVKIGPDVVTKMPIFSYSHVGKVALLTTGGHLILDPSALDVRFSTEASSLNFHKKQAYKLAITVVCHNYLRGINSGIWGFPVGVAELKQWETQSKVTFTETQVSTLLSVKFENKSKKKARGIALEEEEDSDVILL